MAPRYSAGELYVILTWDEARVSEAVSSPGFSERFYVDLDHGSCYRVSDDSGMELLKVQITAPDGKVKDASMPVGVFWRRYIVGRPGPVLIVLHSFEASEANLFRRDRVDLKPPRNAAVVLVTGSMEGVPAKILASASSIEEKYVAGEDELASVFGAADRRRLASLQGLTLGEARDIARGMAENGWSWEEVERRALKLKTTRLMSVGVDTDPNIGGIYDASIDTPYLRLLANYVESGAVCFVGPPGSGKTYMAKRLLGTKYGNPFVMDAGRILERGGEIMFQTALTFLRHMGRVGLLINEYDRLVSVPRIDARMLRFLEDKRGLLFTATIVMAEGLLKKYGSTYVMSEALRPGRFDEVVPVLPAMEPETRLGQVYEIYRKVSRELKLSRPLSQDELNRIAFAAPLLYPAEYEALLIKYSQDHDNLSQFLDEYDPETRAEVCHHTIESCRRTGNVSATLATTLEEMVESALASW